MKYVKRPRNKQKIETRTGSLGPELKHWCIRRDQTIDFLRRMNLDWSDEFLDIGDHNDMAVHICNEFGCRYFSTLGDLDSNSWFYYGSIHKPVITCLDVIEHLLNPLNFLKKLREEMDLNSRLVVTYPHSNSFFWNKKHWHEFYENEFLYLLKRAGLIALHMEKKRVDLIKIRYFWIVGR